MLPESLTTDRERLIADFLASCSNALLKTYAPHLVSVFGLGVNALTFGQVVRCSSIFCNPIGFMKVDQRPMLGEPWRANCKFHGS